MTTTRNRGGRPRGSHQTEEAKHKISEGMKRHWANQRIKEAVIAQKLARLAELEAAAS